MSSDSQDRFGMPESALKAAWKAHGHSVYFGGEEVPMFRRGMYVPTREEVATAPLDEMEPIIEEWMWESPSEIIPTRDMIANVLSVLEARQDAAELKDLIAKCREYVEGD